MTNEPTRAEWSAVPLDVLREHYRERADRTSVRAAADAAGVGRTTLHNFLAGDTEPHPRVRRLLAVAYLREQAPGAGEGADVAFAILSGYFPQPEDRERVRRRMADALGEEFRRAGMEPPPWLDELAG